MLSNSLRLATLIFIVSVTACASYAGKPNSNKAANHNIVSSAPLLAIPLQPAYRLQVELLRLEQMMAQANNEPMQMARLYYERGTVYDSLGLHTLARLDFSRTLKLRPDYADAYNFIGVYLTLEQQFGTAFEAFDSALELSPELEYAYLNRGIALHYSGKNSLALRDMNSFLNKNPTDSYRVIWHYLVQAELEPQLAMSELATRYDQNKNDDWGWKIIGLLSHRLNEQELFALINNDQVSNDVLAERLCETYFYLAKQKLTQDPQTAAYYFKLAASTNVYGFIEHRYALLELDMLHQNMLIQ